MKNKIIVAAALMLSLAATAQKDELKALKKLSESTTQLTPAQATEYKTLFGNFESKMGSATDEQKRDFYYYRAKYYIADATANPANGLVAIPAAMDDFDKVLEMEKAGKKKYSDEINMMLPAVKQNIVTVAGQLAQNNMLKESGAAFALAYKIDPKDPSMLYNSAAMYVNGQDYDNALKNYLELEKIGYTGEGTVYTAKNKKTGEVEAFPNQNTRDIAVQQNLYSEPKNEKLPSMKGEIVKNIALIYVQKGENDKAKQAIATARKANPDDTNLIITEADLYLKANDMVTYKKLIEEATAKNPNNADLYYNLGVVSQSTNPTEAEANYNKALAINPNYTNALNNLGTLMLRDEEKIVKEMNSLGTSAKDNQRYEVLKKQRDAMYKKALPYFERAHKAAPDDQYAITMLYNLYQAMEMMPEAKAMKALIKKQ